MPYDREEKLRQQMFSRRAVLLGAGQTAAFGILGARMYYLQVLEADQYALAADENRINYRIVPPLRGRILDRFGSVLASNRENFQIIVIPEETTNLEDTLTRISDIVPLSEHDSKKVLNRARRQRAFVPITVMENLTWSQFSEISVRGPSLPGVLPQMGATRQYRYGKEFAHIIGYVSTANESEADGDPLLLMPGFHVGKNGVEKTHDLDLRGKSGTRKVEVNAGGRVIRELDQIESESGEDVVLTVDMEVQRYAMERLEGESAAMAAIDVRNGEILSLVSAPGFDANAFVGGINTKLWEQLTTDKYNPLLNKALKGQYPPGSTFKMVVALAALENGIVTPRDRVSCYGRYRFGNHDFHCWKRRGHGRMDMHNAIKQSCDIYFYDVAKRVGIDRIAEMAHKLGLGQTLGFDIYGAKGGAIPSKGWKMAHLSQPWYQGETLVAGIGQGYVLTTPLQLAVMTARIANGGYAVDPHIVRSVGSRSLVPSIVPKLDISEESMRIIHAGMNGVVNEPRGTAGRSRIDYNGITMAGKTGTSQVRRITKAERARGITKNSQLPWHRRDHALFVCYAPVDNPRYAVSVVVEHGGGGSRAAAPVAKDIMLKILERDPANQPPYVPAGDAKAADLEDTGSGKGDFRGDSS